VRATSYLLASLSTELIGQPRGMLRGGASIWSLDLEVDRAVARKQDVGKSKIEL
jgi:hypothetical protein